MFHLVKFHHAPVDGKLGRFFSRLLFEKTPRPSKWFWCFKNSSCFEKWTNHLAILRWIVTFLGIGFYRDPKSSPWILTSNDRGKKKSRIESRGNSYIFMTKRIILKTSRWNSENWRENNPKSCWHLKEIIGRWSQTWVHIQTQKMNKHKNEKLHISVRTPSVCVYIYT